MDQTPVILIVLVIVGIIAFFSYYFSKKAIIKRKLKNAPLKNLTDFRSGETAKITGKIEFVEKPLIAPLSKRECAFYHIVVEEKVSSGKSTRWKTIIEEEAYNKFVISENNKYAYINDKSIKAYLVQDRNYSSGFLNDAADGLEEFLRKHGKKSEGFFGFNKTIRYKEAILEHGEEVAVYGKGTWKYSNELNLPDTYNKVLAISATEDGSVYLSDDYDTL